MCGNLIGNGTGPISHPTVLVVMIEFVLMNNRLRGTHPLFFFKSIQKKNDICYVCNFNLKSTCLNTAIK